MYPNNNIIQPIYNTYNLPVSYYSMVYRGGFAIPHDLQGVYFLMSTNYEIELREFINDPWGAYIFSCQCYSDKILKYRQEAPYLPNYEDVLNAPFHDVYHDITQVPETRYFALLNHNAVMVCDNVQNAVEFLNYYHPCQLKEFDDADEAKWWINYSILKVILPQSAYIDTDIPYISCFEMNRCLTVDYITWLAQHCHLPQGRSFDYIPPNPHFLPEHL